MFKESLMKPRVKSRDRSSRSSSRRRKDGLSDSYAGLVKELTAAFKVFDKDEDGRVSKNELGTVLRSLGDDLNDSELDEIIQRVDGDGDGYIDLQEFIKFHTERNSSRSELARSTSEIRAEGDHDDSSTEENAALQSAFDLFDVDKNGFISAEELHRMVVSLGDKHTSLDDCRHMIRCVDKDGDDNVNFNEFLSLMSGASPNELHSN